MDGLPVVVMVVLIAACFLLLRGVIIPDDIDTVVNTK